MSPDERDAVAASELAARLAAKDARIAELEAVVAVQAARIAEQDAKLAQLEKQVAELLQKLGRNSGNSNLLPSSDGPGQRKGPPSRAGLGKRKRGGQQGHRGSRRALLAAEHVDDVVNLYPSHCAHCSASLPEVMDRWAMRHQFTELPAFVSGAEEARVFGWKRG